MAEPDRNLTPDELIELVNNNTNVVGEVLNGARKQRHFLYVTLLREQVMNNLFPARAMSKQTKQNRLRRYISHIYNTHFGENGEVFATNSTKELYDEMYALVARRINDLKERKRTQGKASNEATTGQNDSPGVRQARRVPRAAPAGPVAAPAAAPAARVGQRRRASSSPKTSSSSSSNEVNQIALLLGDMNINRQRRIRRAVRPRGEQPQQLTARQQAARTAAQERTQAEEAARVRQQANVQARQQRRTIAADTRRAAEGELPELIEQFRL